MTGLLLVVIFLQLEGLQILLDDIEYLKQV
jgi:hypothetical protein